MPTEQTSKPVKGDFSTETEMIVHLSPSPTPDPAGRIRFTAFWIGYHPATGHGVRGQVFRTSLDRFVAGIEAQEWTVRVVNP